MESLRQNVDVLLEERKAEIQELQKRCEDVLPKENNEDFLYDEIFLLRYVLTHCKKGKTNGLNKAERAVRETVKWRQEHKATLEEVRRTGKAPKDDIVSIFFTGGRCGDFEGLEPIYVSRVGHCNFKALMATLSIEEVSDWLHYTKEYNYELCDKRTRESRKLVKTITITDFSNFSMFSGDRRFYQAVGESSKRAAVLYPQFLAKNVLINTPVYIRKVMAACSIFFPKSFLEKISVCPATGTFLPSSPRATACPFVKQVTSDLNDLPTLLGGTGPTPQYLLPRSDCDNALQKVDIKRASSIDLKIDIPEEDVDATWEVMVQDNKLKIYAFLTPDDGSKEIEVIPEMQLKAEDGLKSGIVHIAKKGVLKWTFDNGSGYLSGRTVEYRMTVDQHVDEDQKSQSNTPQKKDKVFDVADLVEALSS